MSESRDICPCGAWFRMTLPGWLCGCDSEMVMSESVHEYCGRSCYELAVLRSCNGQNGAGILASVSGQGPVR